MSSAQERIETAFAIEETTKEIQNGVLRLSATDQALSRLQVQLEAASSRLTHFENNLIHMKQAADVVDIGEFAQTKLFYRDALEEKQSLNIAYATELTKHRKLTFIVESLRSRRELLQQSLLQEAEIIPFPSK